MSVAGRVAVWGAAALAVLMSPGALKAAEWWFVGSSKDSAHFIDRESIKEFSLAGRKIYRAWMADYKSATRDGWKSQKVLVYVDCSDASISEKSYIEYRADGDVARSDTYSDYSLKWTPTAPGTVGEGKLLFVCNSNMGAGDAISFEVDGNEFLFVATLEDGARQYTPRPPAPPRPAAKAPAPKAQVQKRR
ncbi:surface-adhesin E family protein [Phenylobacterium sp.]|uniref:surface-adhesin E family protein n=1 Tax=Phenylobacterium sp. TaxID=1871053 RepID=UPI003BA9AC0A